MDYQCIGTSLEGPWGGGVVVDCAFVVRALFNRKGAVYCYIYQFAIIFLSLFHTELRTDFTERVARS